MEKMTSGNQQNYLNTSPPTYDQAIGGATTTNQPGFSQFQTPPIGFIPTSTYSNAPPPTRLHTANTLQQPQVVIIQNNTPLLGPRATVVTCPFCHVQKMTHVELEPGSKTHLFAALLCIVGFWCCACLPYCMETCMNINHYCGNCNKFLGTYNSGSL